MKSKASQLTALLCAVMLIVCVGCGGRSQVTGKVTFSDGTPLTYGTVNFVSADTMCKGQIEKDGSYRMRTFKPGDGVPPGTYKIYLTDTLQFGESKTAETKGAEKGDSVEYQMVGQATNTVPPQYGNPDESPFGEITVKGTTKKDLVIEAAAPASAPAAE